MIGLPATGEVNAASVERWNSYVRLCPEGGVTQLAGTLQSKTGVVSLVTAACLSDPGTAVWIPGAAGTGGVTVKWRDSDWGREGCPITWTRQ